MIYVYAITEPDADPPACPGLDEQPLSMKRTAGVAAVYSRHDDGEFAPEPEVLWRHDRVVEAAMATGSVLPARFGTTFVDAATLGAALERVQDRLVRQLEGVRGCVELAVRVSLPDTPAAVPRTGSDYVRARLARRREREAAAERTLKPLAAHAVRSRSSSSSTETGTLTASYLVRAGEVDRFAEQVRLLAGRHSQLSVSCTGPWPPYSFVDEDEPPTGALPAQRRLAGSEAR